VKDNTTRTDVLRALASIGQLGLNIVLPCVAFPCLAVYLAGRFALGGWVIAVGFLCGILTAASAFFRFRREWVARMSRGESTRDHAAPAPPQKTPPITQQKEKENPNE